MMAYLEIDTLKNHILTITLNRPEKHNAFDDLLITELSAALSYAENNHPIRVVILKAKGENFCAGADLKWMQQMVNFSKEENTEDALKLSHLFHKLNHLTKPTIAVAKGKTFGGGIGLLACCDIVLAEENASFCFSEVKIGMAPATIAPYILAKFGQAACRRYFLTADRFSAE